MNMPNLHRKMGYVIWLICILILFIYIMCDMMRFYIKEVFILKDKVELLKYEVKILRDKIETVEDSGYILKKNIMPSCVIK